MSNLLGSLFFFTHLDFHLASLLIVLKLHFSERFVLEKILKF